MFGQPLGGPARRDVTSGFGKGPRVVPSGSPRPGQGERVAPQGVSVFAPHGDGIARGNRVEVALRGPAPLRPRMTIPPLAQDLPARGGSPHRFGDARYRLLQRGASGEVHRAPHQSQCQEVDVAMANPGKTTSPPESTLGEVPEPLADFPGGSDGHDPSLPAGERPDDGSAGVRRIDPAVVESNPAYGKGGGNVPPPSTTGSLDRVPGEPAVPRTCR